MGLGQPDFDTPQNIKDAAVKALAEGRTGYTNNAGIDELRLAVADKLRRENGLEFAKDNILITAGGSGALHAAVQCLIEEGDKLVFNNPGLFPMAVLQNLPGESPTRFRSRLHCIWTLKP